MTDRSSDAPVTRTPPGRQSAAPTREARRMVGDYELGERLGLGGMAEVFEADRLGPHGFRKTFALKRILPQVARDRAFVGMFIDEARLVARLNHPNIVQVFDFGEDGGTLYQTMELVRGTSVSRLMRVMAARGDAVPLETALYITLQVARALAHAHALRDDEGCLLNLVHRDVSPGNVLVDRTGHVKLTDFGIAHTRIGERHTQPRNLRGKLGYMSPEQVTGQKLTARSDVFTLGIIMAEMLLGETLFADGSDLDILLRIRDVDLGVLLRSQRRIPSDVCKLLQLALNPTADERPDAEALAESLDAIMCHRGLARSPAEKLAQLLVRYELVAAEPGANPLEPGARPTALVPLDGAIEGAAVAQTTRTDFGFVERVRYFMQLPGGPRLDGVPFPELVRLCVTGVVGAAQLVARGGDTPVPASHLPELSRLFSTPALQWDQSELRDPRLRGGLSAAILLPLIHSLAAHRETGMLYLEDGSRRKKIYFVDGRPDFVASTSRQEMLGEYLVKQNHCLPMELDMALAVLPQHEGRLGDSLVDLGVMRPVELYRAVSAQVRSRYLEAFRWRTGNWVYVRAASSQEDTYPLEQDAQILMRDAATELNASELESALAPLWEKVLRPVVAPPAPLNAYQLPDSWRWVIDQVRGDATVGSVFGHCSQQTGMDAEDAMRALFLGVSCQLLEAA